MMHAMTPVIWRSIRSRLTDLGPKRKRLEGYSSQSVHRFSTSTSSLMEASFGFSSNSAHFKFTGFLFFFFFNQFRLFLSKEIQLFSDFFPGGSFTATRPFSKRLLRVEFCYFHFPISFFTIVLYNFVLFKRLNFVLLFSSLRTRIPSASFSFAHRRPPAERR